MTDTKLSIDLNDALSQAIVERFFKPDTTMSHVDPNTGVIMTHQSPNPLAIIAGQMYGQHANEIMNGLWKRINLDELTELVAGKLADQVVKSFTEDTRSYYSREINPSHKVLRERIMDIVSQTLGKRVVDQMDIQLGTKALDPSPTEE